MRLHKIQILLILIYSLFVLGILVSYAQSDNINLIAFPLLSQCKHNDNLYDCSKNIKIVNPDNNSFIHVNTESTGISSVKFSPDEQIISYLSSQRILYLFDLNKLQEMYQLQLNETEVSSWYSWSPNSKLIAITDIDTDSSLNNLYLLHTDSWQYEQITDDLNVASHMSWSPDGNKLLFSASQTTDFGVNDIYLLDIATYKITNITNKTGYNYFPNWSSEGSKFIHTSGDTGFEKLIVRNEVEVFQAIQIDEQSFGNPEWVLNDTNIILYMDIDRGSVLYIIDMATGEINPIGNSEPISDYDISSSSDRLVFLTTLPDSHLCIIDLLTLSENCLSDQTPFPSGAPVWSKS